MAKFYITKERIKSILQEHKTPEISEATEKWAEKVLADIVYQMQEEAKEREEKLATREDLKTMFEAMQKQMDDRFEAMQKQMDDRFTKVDERFEAMQKQMDNRFEMLIKEMNLRFQNVDVRFEAMQKENNARFLAIDTKFEALEKRLSTITWLIGISTTSLAILIAIMNFLKH